MMNDDFDIDDSPFAKEMQLMLPPAPSDALTVFCAYQSKIVINMDPTQYHNPRRDASMLLAFIINHLPRETWEHFTTELFTRFIAPHMMDAKAAQESQVLVNELNENVSLLSNKVKKMRKPKPVDKVEE